MSVTFRFCSLIVYLGQSSVITHYGESLSSFTMTFQIIIEANARHHREAGFIADPVDAVVMQASFVF